MNDYFEHKNTGGTMRFTEALSTFKKYLDLNTRTEKARKRYSPNTVELYLRISGYFGVFLKTEIPDIWEDVSLLRPRHLFAYQEYNERLINPFNGKPISEITNNSRVLVVKQFARFLYFIDIVEKDPTKGVIIPLPEQKDVSEMKGLLTTEEFQNRIHGFINEAIRHKEFESLRDITFCRLLFATGLRASAALGIRRENINLGDRSVRVTEKGGKVCTRFFDNETADHITRLLKYMDNNLKAMELPYLFVTRKAWKKKGFIWWDYRQMNYHRALGAVHRVVGTSPHKLRHSFAIACVEKGVDPYTLMNLMGHANVATTSIYTRKNEEMMKKDYAKYAPFS